MKKLLLTIPVISTTYATQVTPNNCFEFLAGINSGASISHYDIGEKDLTMSTKIANNDINAWNAVSIPKTKCVPFIEAEVAAQYLMNNVFIGASIAGGGQYRWKIY